MVQCLEEGVQFRGILHARCRLDTGRQIHGAGPVFAQFPRRSSLLEGIEPGTRIAIEVTHARAYPHAA